jgi:oxygen-dependent protoporphyrinogen oxidase
MPHPSSMSRRIVVIGGGIAGLAAANRLLELRNAESRDYEILLLESSTRLGGAIATEHSGGFLLEAGPDSFITEKPAAMKLCERLGLGARLVSTQAAHQKIYVVRNGRLELLPEGFFLLAPTRLRPFMRTSLFSWPGKLRMAAELLLPRAAVKADESLGSFVRRRFGAEALERVAQPLIGGIYAADPDRLSLKSTMPRFLEMERRQRSLIYAMWSAQRRRRREAGSGARWSLFVTLAGGMEELVQALAGRLPEGAIHPRSRVTSLSYDHHRRIWHIPAGADGTTPADGIIIATPAYSAAEMISSLAPAAAAALKNMPYASTATVSLAFRQADFPRPPDSFGFVVPAVEKRKLVACTFSSLKYPGRAPEGTILLRAFVGGRLQPELFNDDDPVMVRNVRAELAALLGVTAEPILSRVWRHASSMPQYEVGHEARINQVRGELRAFPTLALAGSAYSGVGISDCVRTGEEAAEAVIEAIANSQ